jgi:hypothetical protein
MWQLVVELLVAQLPIEAPAVTSFSVYVTVVVE